MKTQSIFVIEHGKGCVSTSTELRENQFIDKNYDLFDLVNNYSERPEIVLEYLESLVKKYKEINKL